MSASGNSIRKCPESFNVLIRELQSLCLDVELVKKQHAMIETALAAD